jgi:hypothetical protein
VERVCKGLTAAVTQYLTALRKHERTSAPLASTLGQGNHEELDVRVSIFER